MYMTANVLSRRRGANQVVRSFLLNSLPLLDVCVSSLRRGHANLLCIVQMLTDDPRRESSQILHTKILSIKSPADLPVFGAISPL